MKLFAHQQRFIDKNPDRAMLVWETGTGKTVAACEWAKSKKRPAGRKLVACPKSIIGKWEKALKEWKVFYVDVVSRDEIKTIDLSKYQSLILDEGQDFASPLFDKKRPPSDRARVVYDWVKTHENGHILILTATPVRSTPWNIHTLGAYLRIFWDIREFRDEFFYLTDLYGHMHYEKVKGWQKLIRPYVESISDIVLMQDCVDVPQETHQVINIDWSKKHEEELKAQYLEPAAEWHARHRMENGDTKYKRLEDICDGYRKVIVVCFYRDQIDEYAKKLSKERLVFVLHGGVKDQDKVIQDAQDADDCIFIIQASMGSGFDADKFSVVVFASMSFRYVDYVQMKGRVKRIHNLHDVTFIHLLAGKCDRAVYDTIQNNKDFDVHDYLKRTPGSPKEKEKERAERDPDSFGVVPLAPPF